MITDVCGAVGLKDARLLGRLPVRAATDIAASRFSIGCECLDRGMWQFVRALPRMPLADRQRVR